MQELLRTTSEVSAAITDILTVLRDSVKVVVTEISTELASFANTITFAVSYSIVGLIDDIFDLYSYEWIIANRFIQELDNWINNLVYNKLTHINTIINKFTAITDTLIQMSADQLAAIDESVTVEYNKRMFAIYGHIAEFSVAIDAPPSYLEEAIQNARFFAMAIACSAGMSYYQFQSTWSVGIERLLIRITNSLSLYRQNPQWIKIDIEEGLIKPIFELEVVNRRKEKERITTLGNIISDLQNLMNTHKIQIDENKQEIIALYEVKIEPALKEITDSFDRWEKDVYDIKMGTTDAYLNRLSLYLIEALNTAKTTLKLLDYGGDLLLRVDTLADYLRIEQEDKIGEIATRSFRRLVPEWTATVKEGIG